MKIRPLLITTATIVMLAYILVGIPGCNKLENLTNSGSKLILDAITGIDYEGNPNSTTVFSDVITSSGSIRPDIATADISAVLLDPGFTAGTFYQDIIVDQVDIVFTRNDMINPIEGEDVPYRFSQKVSFRVEVGAPSSSLSFVLVQHINKLESPLVELVSFGQEHVLKMEAKCTFHARDIAGNRVEPAVGSISVWFANFADED